jgi:predicted DCC family thiol-disulfide oxidoreductase YuxK
MSGTKRVIRVFYDQACPSCRKDRVFYEGLHQAEADQVDWVDANDPKACLIEKGIDPKQALLELYIEIENEDGSREILSEIPAYVVLMQRTRLLKPLSILIGLPLIRPMLSRLYRRWVKQRLQRQGRL